MTAPGIAALGPAFAAHPRRFRDGLGRDRAAGHLDTSCRGPLSDRPRGGGEPIAPGAGTAVRARREFRAAARGDHGRARGAPQAHRAAVLAGLPAGRMDYGGRDDTGLLRHLTPAVAALGCVAAHTGRPRGGTRRRRPSRRAGR